MKIRKLFTLFNFRLDFSIVVILYKLFQQWVWGTDRADSWDPSDLKRRWYQLINRLNLYYIQLMYTETCDRGKARVRAGHGHIGANYYCQWQGQERKITILHAIQATLILKKIYLSRDRKCSGWTYSIILSIYSLVNPVFLNVPESEMGIYIL